MLSKVTALLMACAMIPSLASASVQHYDNEISFLAAASQYVMKMESFEQLPVDNHPGVLAVDSLPCIYPTLALPDFTLVAESETLSVADLDRVAGMHATDAAQYVIHYYGTHEISMHQLDFMFEVPIYAFGVNVADWGDVANKNPLGGNLEFNNNTGYEHVIASAPRPSDNDLFFGIVSETPFTRATLTHTQIGDSYSIDETYYGVPEPTTLLALVIGSIVIQRKRR